MTKLLRPGFVPVPPKNSRLYVPSALPDDLRALRGDHAVYNFLQHYYHVKGAKGTKRLARWSPELGDGKGGVLLEGATEDDLGFGVLHMRGATIMPGRGVVYNAAEHFRDADAAQATPFVWYRDLMAETGKQDPILHCFGLHEWAMQYWPEGAPPPPSSKYQQGAMELRVSREVINAAVERKGVSCTHVDALRFFAPAAAPLNRHGATLEREQQLSLEQPGCVHAHMDLLKMALRLTPWIAAELVGDALEIALAARSLDVAASPYDASAFGLQPIPVETLHGRNEYRKQQEELMARAQPVRAELLKAYEAFLPLAFGVERVSEAAANPGAERFATASPGGQPWRQSLIAPPPPPPPSRASADTMRMMLSDPSEDASPAATSSTEPVAVHSERALLLLREAAQRLPPTPPALARSLRGCAKASTEGAKGAEGAQGIEGTAGGGSAFVLLNPSEYNRDAGGKGKRRKRRRGPPPPNELFPELASELFALEQRMRPSAQAAAPAPSRCMVATNAELCPMSLSGGANAAGEVLVASLGDHSGLELVLGGGEHGSHQTGGQTCDVRHTPVAFDAERTFWTLPATATLGGEAESFTLIWFTRAKEPLPLREAAANLAASLAPPLQYREGSTDVNVIAEVLGKRCYAGPLRGDPRWEGVDWSPKGHAVLDVGAHIGAFARFCLQGGAVSVLALEPEPSNAELCRANVAHTLCVEVRELAVLHGASPSGIRESDLVLGRTRSDGVANTWRHALQGLSHYRDDAAGGAPTRAEAAAGSVEALERIRVQTRPLLGADGILTPEHTFVKLDCEGAELEILDHFAKGDWLNVKRLTIEYSFTKARSMARFAAAVEALEAEGFTVGYEGKGNWVESFAEWPWDVDALIFAWR